MNSGTIWGRFVEKSSGKKSRATVPLRSILNEDVLMIIASAIVIIISGNKLCFLPSSGNHGKLLGFRNKVQNIYLFIYLLLSNDLKTEFNSKAKLFNLLFYQLPSQKQEKLDISS